MTDNDGATNTHTTNVTVSEAGQTGDISFVDSDTGSGNTMTPGVTVPGSVQAGDTLVLTASMGNATSASPPSGWTQVGDESSSSALRSMVWVRTATADDAGSPVTVTMDSVHKVALVLTAYRGVDASGVSASASTDASTDTHTTPDVTVPAGSWVVSAWGDKSANTDWTTPGSLTARDAAYTTGGGSVSLAVADSDGPRTGAVSGSTATSSVSSARGVNWSITLPAA